MGLRYCKIGRINSEVEVDVIWWGEMWMLMHVEILMSEGAGFMCTNMECNYYMSELRSD
jgi:3,4-dihydroxy-2-butanone 4-phosphate synthase